MFLHQKLRELFRHCSYVVCAALLLGACGEHAATSDQTTLQSLTYAAVPGDDAPQLAHLGPYRVGVRTLSFSYEDSPDVAVVDHVIGTTTTWTRRLTVDVLYPADVPQHQAADAVYTGTYETGLTDVQGLPGTFEIQGIAVRDAPVIPSVRFPLVIVSHGLLNTPGVLSGITENLASKGYVVAAIDHRDGSDAPATPVHMFARVLLNRARDQARILDEMSTLAQKGTKNGAQHPLGAAIDASAVGLIGFSMGGYGVITHAGASLDPEGESLGFVPEETLSAVIRSSRELFAESRRRVGAAVVFAPWGGKAGDVWTDAALAEIKSPMLILAGDQDDISDFGHGIQRIFNKASGTDRYLLVFQNAQHNLVQVPAPPSAHLDVVPWMTFEDPVWRRDRLLAIGAHFVTAFLDWQLKADDSKRAYLEVPTTRSADGQWPQSFATDYSDQYADGSNGSEQYWRGFKRRQAMGLELHNLERGVSN